MQSPTQLTSTPNAPRGGAEKTVPDPVIEIYHERTVAAALQTNYRVEPVYCFSDAERSSSRTYCG